MPDQVRYRYVAVLQGMMLVAIALMVGGCEMFGVVAEKISPGSGSVQPQYKGLKDQTVGVMVWADRGISIDHANVELEVAKKVQADLKEAQDAKISDLDGTTWVKPEKIARFQEDHPELDGEDIAKVAPKLPSLTRLIYVEVTSLSLHPSDAVDLTRGDISVDIKVYEVDGEKVKPAYQENDIAIVYPRKSPPEGVLGLDEDEAYKGSLAEISKEIATRFVTHEADAE